MANGVTVNAGWDTGVFLLDNVAYLDQEGVHVLDRRVYPFEIRWETCSTTNDVARAIIDMVTQSRGPGVVAAYGMVLAAQESAASTDPVATLERLSQMIIGTRPTNHAVRRSVRTALSVCSGPPDGWANRVTETVVAAEILRRKRAEQLGVVGAGLLRDGARVLTNCWAESGLVQAVVAGVTAGHAITVYCPETRPYLQGSRLTADALRDAGAEVTVVPDNAVGYLVSEGLIDIAITGSDRVAADGAVVNKIGTLSIAMLCARFGVPFYAICPSVDVSIPTAADVPVEIRDGQEALECLGLPTATHDVAGFYPAFDRTPAELVTGLVTPDGVIAPHELKGGLV